MISPEFQDGYLVYEVKVISEPGSLPPILKQHWDDGYVAFSRGEIRWNNFLKNFSGKWTDLLTQRHFMKGIEGYIMEIDLWRDEAGILYEELSLEREDGGFLFQLFKLHVDKATLGTDHAFECYYRYCRHAYTISRAKPIFNTGELSFVEVIVPDYRLNIFLTTKR